MQLTDEYAPSDNAPARDAEQIRQLADQGWSRNQIAAELGGRRADALARIRAVLDEHSVG
jgi:alkylation response protein AidB-like acyl-CoA dehydrogenase